MRIVFSRKGFDSTSGGGPSPIIDGVPVTLPIPDTKGLSKTTYRDLGLDSRVARASRGKVGGDDLCHHDPMFLNDGTVMLGQCHRSQSHLAKRGVGAGDVFLFFGLFADERTGEPHHRIFGWMEVARVFDLSLADCASPELRRAAGERHPHLLGLHHDNDALYVGEGAMASSDDCALRLTVPGGPVTLWRRPSWLQRGGISYFPDKDANWPAPDRMYRVGNGQEFVADIGKRSEPREWLAQIIAEIRAS